MSMNADSHSDALEETRWRFAGKAQSSISRLDVEILESAMQQAGAGYWCLNLQTCELQMSDSLRLRLTEAELKQINEVGLGAIMHEDDLASMRARWCDDVKSGFIDSTYRLSLEKEGEIWQHGRGRVKYAKDGTPLSVVCFVVDETERLTRTRKLAESERASKAKTDFLALMSHEIRTPLNAIIGMADAIQDENLCPSARETVDDIGEAAQGLHQLLTQTLDHATLISVEATPDWELADPKRAVEDCVRLWRPQCAKKGLELKVLHGQALPSSMLMDVTRLGQCLNNLLSNAVKFTAAGKISVLLKRADYKGTDSLVLAVKDSGIGMSAEAASRVFEEFYQADSSIKRKYGGTGLGMNITKRLVKLMDGQVKVSSQDGEGSTFLIILPIRKKIEIGSAIVDAKLETQLKEIALRGKEEAKDEAGDKSKAPAPRVQPATKHSHSPKNEPVKDEEFPPFTGLTVLCVEDNPVNRKVVQKLIGRRVDQLYFAENGKEALKILSATPVDIVLMDIHMPVMDGIETTLEIRNSAAPWANVIVLALTADPSYQQARICRNLGMNGTIAKPVTREDIAYAFEHAMTSVGTAFGQVAHLPKAAMG